MRALLLLSGGLDSTLAARILLDQKVDLLALNFTSPFCTCTKKGCQSEAKKVAEKLHIPIRTISKGADYIQIVKHPKFGYGKNLNPCIDCRIFMFSKAKKIMHEMGALFIITGEVLGERPMSQKRWSMKKIEQESGLEGLILRPLSAKLMKPTLPGKKGWIDRDKLLSISGRSRKPQITLANDLNITDYPCPAGGCRLTDSNYAKRLKDLFNHDDESTMNIQLLRTGRHFRLPSGTKIIVGRNETENQMLESLSSNPMISLTSAEIGEGPTTILPQLIDKDDIKYAGSITLRYSDVSKNIGKVKISNGNGQDEIYNVPAIDESEWIGFRI